MTQKGKILKSNKSLLGRISMTLASAAVIGAFVIAPVEVRAQTATPMTATDPDPDTTIAYWTPARLANAKPMPMPQATVGVAFQTEIEAPPASGISAPGHGPTVNVQTDDRVLFTPADRGLIAAIKPGRSTRADRIGVIAIHQFAIGGRQGRGSGEAISIQD